MKKTLLIALMCFGVMSISQAQIQAPAPSPASFVSQNVGFTKISIDYSAPGVKGRKVWGELVPYGTPWRAGANSPTMIEFSTAVKIGGEDVRAGKYSVFITPAESGAWTIHLNKTGKQIYDYMKDGKVDMDALSKDLAVNVKATPTTVAQSRERLTYLINANDNKSATIGMIWDKTRLAFDVDVRTAEIMAGFSNTLK